jgi:phospho-N-acetylmuramoyl-pentapeptide-transferase
VPLLLALAAGYPVIKLLKSAKSIQSFRDQGPKSHVTEKAGTPTMGSWIFVIPFSAMAISLIFTEVSSKLTIVLAAFILAFIMGLIDDGIKVFEGSYEGLSSGKKLILQFIIAALVAVFSTRVHLDFMHFAEITWLIALTTILQISWAFIVLAGTSNALNFTDGLDGLATTQAVICLIGLCFIAYINNDYNLLLAMLAMIFSLLGFLFFNRKPAKVFMGDSGSLALGMLIASFAYISRAEWYLLIFALVPVLEVLSVVIQVTYYKLTKKLTGAGKRIFKMSPLHHHFELCGWSETKIVWIFGLVQLALVVGFIIFKLNFVV